MNIVEGRWLGKEAWHLHVVSIQDYLEKPFEIFEKSETMDMLLWFIIHMFI